MCEPVQKYCPLPLILRHRSRIGILYSLATLVKCAPDKSPEKGVNPSRRFTQ